MAETVRFALITVLVPLGIVELAVRVAGFLLYIVLTGFIFGLIALEGNEGRVEAFLTPACFTLAKEL